MDEGQEHGVGMVPPLLLERLSGAARYASTLAPSFHQLSLAAKALIVATALLTLLAAFRAISSIVRIAIAVLGSILRAIISPFRGRRRSAQSQQQRQPTPRHQQQPTTRQPQQPKATSASRGKGGIRRRGNPAAEAEEEQERHPPSKPAPPGTSLKALARAAAASPAGNKGMGSRASASPLHLCWLKGHGDGIASVCFSSDGAFLLTASRDRGLRQWPMMATPQGAGGDGSASAPPLKRGSQPTPAQPRLRTLHVSPLAAAFIGGDPSKIAVLSRDGINGPTLSAFRGFPAAGAGRGGDGDAPLWVASPSPLIAGRRPVALLASSLPRGSQTPPPLLAVVSERTELETYDAETGARTSAVDTGGLRTHGACCCSRGGSSIAVATFASDARAYSFSQEGAPAIVRKAGWSLSHGGQVLAVSLSADGTSAATSSKDGTWCSWKTPAATAAGRGVASGERAEATRIGSWRQDLPPQEFYRLLALSPDASVVAAAAGGDLHFLCPRTGALLEAVAPAHEGEVTALSWAPFKRRVEGGAGGAAPLRWILASGGDDGAVRLWAEPERCGGGGGSGWERGV